MFNQHNYNVGEVVTIKTSDFFWQNKTYFPTFAINFQCNS